MLGSQLYKPGVIKGENLIYQGLHSGLGFIGLVQGFTLSYHNRDL